MPFRSAAPARTGPDVARSARVRLACVAAAAAAAATFAGCSPAPEQRAPAADAAVFHDVTAAAGIRHVHAKPVLDAKVANIMEWVQSVGAAAAAGDFDGDGWIDLYVTTSRKGEPNHLYRNNGDGTFTDVAEAAGLADVNDDGGASMDCAWGDYDNDGRIDLYLVRWGTDRLFRNEGNGRFTETTHDCFRRPDGTPGTQWENGNAVVFLDMDRDGRLDLYVGNYFSPVDLWRLESTRFMHDDFENSRNGGANRFFHQLPDGTFEETAEAMGIEDPGWTLAVGSADVNNDGWPDLYCANDFGPDQLFLGVDGTTFDNVSEVALGFDSKKGMNVDFGDFDNDGWLDIAVTNITTAEYLQEGDMLWHNDGPGDFGIVTFTDVAAEAGAWDGGWGWGAKFVDADLDGLPDLVVQNGFISGNEESYWYDLASWTVLGRDPADAANWPAIGGRSFSGHEPMRFFRAVAPGVFRESAAEAGLDNRADGRGLVVFDYDNDGDPDLYCANQGAAPNLYRNDTTGRHWLLVALVADAATGTNRDAIGARVTLVRDGDMQIRERDGGNGYAGQSDPRLLFGLGARAEIDFVEVAWPDGGVQRVDRPGADALLTVRQDPAAYAEAPRAVAPPPRPRRVATGAKAPPAVSDEQLDRTLASLENELRGSLARYTPASSYRALCVTHRRQDRSIAFFEALVAEHPEPRARMELALAYIDKIPSCGGVAAVVSKGTLARKSLDQMNVVLDELGETWVAYYIRGMNHLHWPRALRHSDDAAEDLRRCVELRARGSGSGDDAHDERTHVALGDALAKAGDTAAAREAWEEAGRLYPGSPLVRERLAAPDDGALQAIIQEARSLERPIDTDLSFLDRRAR